MPGDSPDTLEALNENKVDLAITLPPKESNRFQFQSLFSDNLVMVLSPSHRWCGKGRIPLAELERESVIVYNRRSYTFERIRDYLRSEGIELRNTLELGSMEAIKDLVKIGMGVSVLASWVVEKEVSDATLVIQPLGLQPLQRVWGITMLKQRQCSLMEETFIGLCQSACEQRNWA